MSHWVPIKYISEKYQIDENYICNLIVRKVVTSSQIGRKVKLIDEDSFISYLDLHKEIEDKKEIIPCLSEMRKNAVSFCRSVWENGWI